MAPPSLGLVADFGGAIFPTLSDHDQSNLQRQKKEEKEVEDRQASS
jgi:hypothetical protein